MKEKSGEILRNRGVTVANPRWSHGGKDASAVNWLKCWQDRVEKRDGANWVRATANEKDPKRSLGVPERLAHLEEIRNGTPAKVVLMVPVDPDASPRSESYCSPVVWDVKEIAEHEGNTWLRIEKEAK